MKTNELNRGGEFVPAQQTALANDTLVFNIPVSIGDFGFFGVSYYGANKEYLGLFPFTKVNSFTYSIGAVVHEQTFNGVTLIATFTGENVLSLAFSDGVAGANVKVSYITMS